MLTNGHKGSSSRTEVKSLHRIAQVRNEKNISIKEAALKLGITQAQASLQEKPTSDLTLPQLNAWSKLLGVSAGNLLTSDNEKDRSILDDLTEKQVKQMVSLVNELELSELGFNRQIASDLGRKSNDSNLYVRSGVGRKPVPIISMLKTQFIEAFSKITNVAKEFGLEDE